MTNGKLLAIARSKISRIFNKLLSFSRSEPHPSTPLDHMEHQRWPKQIDGFQGIPNVVKSELSLPDRASVVAKGKSKGRILSRQETSISWSEGKKKIDALLEGTWVWWDFVHL